MAQPDIISDEDAVLLYNMRESGGLSPEERKEADLMLEEYYNFHTNPQTSPDMDIMAIEAMGGDPKAAAQLFSEAAEGATNYAASTVSGLRRVAVGAAKLPLLLADAALDGSEFTGAQATIKAATNQLDKWYSEKQQEETDWFMENFEQVGPNQLFQMAGETVPFFFVPGFSTYTRAVFGGALEGAAGAGMIAAVDADTAADIAGEMTYGGLLGAGASSAFHALPGARAFMSRQLNKEFDTKIAQARMQLEKKIQDITGNKEFSFTIGQIAAENPFLLGLERGAAGRLTAETQRERVQTLVDFLEKRAGNMDPEELLNDMSGIIVEAGRARNALARDRYGAGMARIIEQHGDSLTMSHANGKMYLEALDDFIGELGDPRHINSLDAKALLKHRRFVKDAVMPFRTIRTIGDDGKVTWTVRDVSGRVPDEVFTGRGANTKAATLMMRQNEAMGGLRTDDIMEILKGHNALLTGTASAFEAATHGSSEHIGRRMMAAMMEAMDAQSGAAIQDIRQLRNAFATEMAQVDLLKRSALGRILGDNYTQNGTIDPQVTLDQLMNLGVTSMRKTREILSTYDPDTLDALKGAYVRKVLQEGRDPASPDVLSETDPMLLAEALSGRGKLSNVGRAGLGLFTPLEQSHMIATAKSLRTLQNTFVRDVSKDTAGIAQDITINVVSQSKEFVGRLLARLLSKGHNVEKLMLNPAARDSILAMAEQGVDSTTGRLALATLVSLTGHWDAQDREQMNQEMHQFPGMRE